MANGEDETLDWVVCGRLIGRATGWDQSDTFSMTLYDFQPHELTKGLKPGTLFVNFESGVLEVYSEDDKAPPLSCDLIDAIKDCPRGTL